MILETITGLALGSVPAKKGHAFFFPCGHRIASSLVFLPKLEKNLSSAKVDITFSGEHGDVGSGTGAFLPSWVTVNW
jgi:hypothetical protein